MTATGADHSLRNISLAGYLGSSIEAYDFLIYGTAAALVFPTVFFPHLSPLMGTVASLGSFGAAFLSRPLGAAIFGHFGDRIGRKRTLVLTMSIMGVATLGIGLIPGTADIGMAAPLLLITLRLAQGFAMGGEWAGSVLLGTESAPAGRRGFYGMFTQLGLGTALVLANLVFLAVHLTIGDKSTAFLTWGWRLPFLLSVVLVGVSLLIRTRIREPAGVPVEARDQGETAGRPPLAEMMRRQSREVLLGAAAVAGIFTLAYQVSTFITHYAAVHLHYSKNTILLAGVLGGVCSIGCSAASAILSDTYGPRRLIAIAMTLAVPWSFALMPVIDLRRPVVFLLAVMFTYAVIGVAIGPLPAYLPGVFATRYRYTATAVSYNIGGILGGALPPVVSPALLHAFGSWAIGLMMGALTSVSLAATLLLDPRRVRGEDH